MSKQNFLFTSESVSEGHPDKVADNIADAVLDAHLTQDPLARVACEVMVKDNLVVLGGEITSTAAVDHEFLVRQVIHEIGYTDPAELFHASGVKIINLLGQQSPNIAQGVDTGGAGDQGMMFGYASSETDVSMPLPIYLAHRIVKQLTDARRNPAYAWLRPDAKAQVTVQYDCGAPILVKDVVVSTQHAKGTPQSQIQHFVKNVLLPNAIGYYMGEHVVLHINPTGSFEIGGPSGDCGLTNRKIIVDTYGGMSRHGGGGFSGKDGTKVDRSGAYFARLAAKSIVDAGIAKRCEVQVAYAIGVAQPVSLMVDTFGTGDEAAAEEKLKQFDFRPQAIIERLALRQPIYRKTTNYGHMGKPEMTWEKTV